jgi:hypothetical protein
MKVLLTIDGGFAKTIFEGDKYAVEFFLKGFQCARGKNIESAEVIAVVNAMLELDDKSGNKEDGNLNMEARFAQGVLAAMQNSKGKLEVLNDE